MAAKISLISLIYLMKTLVLWSPHYWCIFFDGLEMIVEYCATKQYSLTHTGVLNTSVIENNVGNFWSLK